MDVTLANSVTGSQSICIVGAGIVGMSAALYLRKDGHAVTILDEREPGTATSFGNAGAIVTCAVEPTSTPGVLGSIPRFLLDRSSAVRIRWRYLPRIAPWLLQFVMESRTHRVRHAAAGLHRLLSQAADAHRELAALAGAADVLRPVGWLKVYRTLQAFEATRLQRQLMDAHGIAYEVLDPDGIAALEPRLASVFVKGLYHRDSLALSSPKALLDAYLQRFLADGGQVIRCLCRHVVPLESGVRVDWDGGSETFDQVVIAAGPWSGSFCAQLGDRVMLDTERGYHLNLELADGSRLTRPVCFPEYSCVLAPMRDGLRLTSGEELAGLDAPPDYSRIRKLLPFVKEVLPDSAFQVTREWMGRRPSTPDSLPVLGRSPRAGRVIYAFGHQHLGMTLGPVTGRIVSEIVAGKSGDLSDYRIDRF